MVVRVGGRNGLTAQCYKACICTLGMVRRGIARPTDQWSTDRRRRGAVRGSRTMHRLGGVWSSCGGHPALHVGCVPLAAAGPPVHRSGLCQRSHIRHLPAWDQAPTTVRVAACPCRAPTLDK